MEKFKKYINILDKGFNALSIAFMVFAIVMAALSVIGFIGIPDVIIGELEGELTLGIMTGVALNEFHCTVKRCDRAVTRSVRSPAFSGH